MKKVIAWAFVALFGLTAFGAGAQAQAGNQKLSPKQEKREVREQRRAQRQAEFESHIDSLITAGEFQFTPSSMRMLPAGSMHLISNPNFNLQYWNGTFDIFLPYIKGVMMPYTLSVLNYTISKPEEYQKEKTAEGWTVTFVSTLFSATPYKFTLDVYAKTGGATLTIGNSWNNTIQYSGTVTGL